MGSTRDSTNLAEAKRATAAEIRRIAKTVLMQDDRTFLISHASWLESEAATLEKAATAGSRRMMVTEQRAAA